LRIVVWGRREGGRKAEREIKKPEQGRESRDAFTMGADRMSAACQ
jgi:hypothetical protein